MITATKETEQTQLRPFDETILTMIDRSIAREMGELATLIRTTKITKNHDRIIAAWINQKKVSGWDWDEEKMGVVVSLLEQKREAEKKAGEVVATDLASSFSHHGKERALMIVIEKIIGIAQNLPEPNQYLYPGARDEISNIFKLFETAKKISNAKTEQDFQAAITDL